MSRRLAELAEGSPPGRSDWLKPIGHAKGPLHVDWFETSPRVLRRTGFPRRPRVQDGDRFVYYASVWKRIFAVVEVISDPEETAPGTRWPWTVQVDPLLVIPILDHAPPVEAMGIAPRSTSQQSHIRISPEHFSRAVDALASVAL
jgi:hypothetical protein